MMVIVLLSTFVQLLVTQYVTCQCIGSYNLAAAPLSDAPYARGSRARFISTQAITSPASCNVASQIGGWDTGLFNAAALAASNGGSFSTTSSSPLTPNGVSISSQSSIQGGLTVTGTVPFLGTVSLEGVLPTGGAGGITYGCGNGNVAILSEDIIDSDAEALRYDSDVLGFETGNLGYGASAFNYNSGLGGALYGYNGANIGGRPACELNTVF